MAQSPQPRLVRLGQARRLTRASDVGDRLEMDPIFLWTKPDDHG